MDITQPTETAMCACMDSVCVCVSVGVFSHSPAFHISQS